MPHERAVHLILKGEYFDAIERGDKTIEYRSNYWKKRIEGKQIVVFHRGYTKRTITFRIRKICDSLNHTEIEIHLGERLHGFTTEPCAIGTSDQIAKAISDAQQVALGG